MPNIPEYNLLNAVLRPPKAPAVIVPICEQLAEQDLDQVLSQADAAELRIDQLLSGGDGMIHTELTRLGALPILATVRLQAEGGGWMGSTQERVNTFESVMPFVQGIDVELQAPDMPELVRRADSKVVIASMHDFVTTPDHLILEARLERALRAGADYFKVAATTNTDDELAQIIGFMERNPLEPIIAVTMGRLGVLGRLELLKRGSRATYVYVGDEPIVPGQLSLADLVALRGLSMPRPG